MRANNTSGPRTLRDAARVHALRIREELEQDALAPAQIAYYLYALSEATQDICEDLIEQFHVGGLLSWMIAHNEPDADDSAIDACA